MAIDEDLEGFLMQAAAGAKFEKTIKPDGAAQPYICGLIIVETGCYGTAADIYKIWGYINGFPFFKETCVGCAAVRTVFDSTVQNVENKIKQLNKWHKRRSNKNK